MLQAQRLNNKHIHHTQRETTLHSHENKICKQDYETRYNSSYYQATSSEALILLDRQTTKESEK